MTELTINLMLRGGVRASLLAPMLLGFAAFIVGILLARTDDLSKQVWGMMLCIGSLLTLSLMVWASRAISRAALATTLAIVHDLRSSMRLTQVSPLQVLESAFDISVLFPSLVCVLFTVLWVGYGRAAAASVALPILFVAQLALLLPRIRGTWRGALLQLQTGWTFVCLVTVGLLLAMAVVACSLFVIAYGLVPRTEPSLTHIPEDVLAALGHSRVHSYSPRLIASRLVQSGGAARRRAATAVIVFTLATGIVALLACRVLANTSDAWRAACLARAQPSKATPPQADEPLVSPLDITLLISHGVLSSVFYWLSALVSIDVIAFIASGEAMLLRPLGWAMALVKSYIQYLLGLSQHSVTIVVAALFLPFAIPGGLLMVASAHRLLGVLWREIAYLRHRPVNGLANVSAFIEKTCRDRGIRAPMLRLVQRNDPAAFSEASLFGFKSRIIVSEKSGRYLDGRELQALLAHEIFHAHKDARMVELLKLCSILLLLPVYYFLILYDFGGREREADTFAVEVMGGPQPLIAALTKLGIFGVFGNAEGQAAKSDPRQRGPKHCKQRRLKRAISILFDDSLFGAAYPFLTERITLKCFTQSETTRRSELGTLPLSG